MKKTFFRRLAFTLIELVIAIAILFILASLAYMNLADTASTSRSARASTIISSVKQAKQLYQVNATATETATFNSASNSAQFSTIASLITVQGQKVTSMSQLLAGSGYTTLTINPLGTDPTISP